MACMHIKGVTCSECEYLWTDSPNSKPVWPIEYQIFEKIARTQGLIEGMLQGLELQFKEIHAKLDRLEKKGRRK